MPKLADGFVPVEVLRMRDGFVADYMIERDQEWRLPDGWEQCAGNPRKDSKCHGSVVRNSRHDPDRAMGLRPEGRFRYSPSFRRHGCPPRYATACRWLVTCGRRRGPQSRRTAIHRSQLALRHAEACFGKDPNQFRIDHTALARASNLSPRSMSVSPVSVGNTAPCRCEFLITHWTNYGLML